MRQDLRLCLYLALKTALLEDVQRERLINSFEFKSTHLVDIERIFEDDYLALPKPDPKKKGKRLSSHDALIVSMASAIALDHAKGYENATIVTGERRMATLCRRLPKRYPRAIDIREDETESYLEGLGLG